MQFNAESQRRSGIRILRPWLSSARMVSLFYRIGMLSITRPGAVATMELFVERMTTKTDRSMLACVPVRTAKLGVLSESGGRR